MQGGGGRNASGRNASAADTFAHNYFHLNSQETLVPQRLHSVVEKNSYAQIAILIFES